MFKRKKKRRVLTVRDRDGRVLFSGESIALEIPEAVLIALSIEFFDDPEPCEIHRGAVKVRVSGELEDALTLGQSVDVSVLSDLLQSCLPEGAVSVVLSEEA